MTSETMPIPRYPETTSRQLERRVESLIARKAGSRDCYDLASSDCRHGPVNLKFD